MDSDEENEDRQMIQVSHVTSPYDVTSPYYVTSLYHVTSPTFLSTSNVSGLVRGDDKSKDEGE